jgi:hypothetical protein
MRNEIMTTRSSIASIEKVLTADTEGQLQHPPTFGSSRVRFKSVLSQPFSHWNRIEDVIAEFMPELSPSQRSCIIQNLLRFLELKVILAEYESKGLLAPTLLVGHAWHVLILETELYRDVSVAIERFHARPHRMIHHSLLRSHDRSEFEQRRDRTQRLFRAYYGTEMPNTLTDVGGTGSQSASAKSDPLTSDAVSASSIADGPPEEEESPSWYDAEPRIGGDRSKRDVMKPHFFPWLPSSCDCFEVVRETVCWSRDGICVDEDIYANMDENVSILTPPDVSPVE